MALIYLDVAETTTYTEEDPVATTFYDECLWKSQQFAAAAPQTDDPLYYDDIDEGGIASDVE